ncbi:MAG TPA: 6,7-dimethyl-8-ribityllumazine synthase [Candidatus Eremiobacteraceae bacterium]|nr:6,7-dimethyl-8-ribityllumazine synthase [Candidatus Eremiobacteraceae bacterium]
MKPKKFAIVRARFNAPITQALLDGALRAFAAAGISSADVKTVEVPGAFELPVAALWLAQSNEYAAIVAVGCVIRGETPHFDFVAGEAARGLGEVALRTGVPVAFGVLTTDTAAQAAARASSVDASSPEHGNTHRTSNKGFEAAQAAMAMAAARREF